MAFRSKRAKQEEIESDKRSKKRRCSESDDDEKRGATASPCVSKLQGSESLGNARSSSHNKPAELFRKDLISAMKLPDTEPLTGEDYFLITDAWRQEWEKGVQVPVNPDSIPAVSIRVTKDQNYGPGDFKLPQGKLFHANQDDNYNKAVHYLTGMQQLADEVVRYDLDDVDVCWLERMNEERVSMGEMAIHEWTMERVMEALETQCHESMQQIIKTSEGLGIEYDENVICDVCRSPDSEDMNEMVFCDNCDICVHQACYGIQTIPEGSWLCRTCAIGIQPQCILCPKKGGAMKGTRSGTKWTHVSCALWIPEVSIGCVEKMEPITKISNIPSSRWALVCCLCRERVGACIQCSIKTCKVAFHVTCAFQHSLEMKTILECDEEDVKLKAYCPKHSKRYKDGLGLIDDVDMPLSPRKEYTQEEKDNMRQEKIKQLEGEFYTCVKITDIATKLQLAEDAVDVIYQYWKLKRKVNFNKPLLTPKTEEADLLSKQQEDSLVARMKMFVHLRQDLERVRNLCYMVSRREKIRRQLYRMKEQIFYQQLEVVENENLSSKDFKTVISANHSEDIYDRPEHVLKVSQQSAMCEEDQQNDSNKSGDESDAPSYSSDSQKRDRKTSGRNMKLNNLHSALVSRRSRREERVVIRSDSVPSAENCRRVKAKDDPFEQQLNIIKVDDEVLSDSPPGLKSDCGIIVGRRKHLNTVDSFEVDSTDRTDGSRVSGKVAELENLPDEHSGMRTRMPRKNGDMGHVLREDQTCHGVLKSEFAESSESEEGSLNTFSHSRQGSESSFTSKSSGVNGLNKQLKYGRLRLKARASDRHRLVKLNGAHENRQTKLENYFVHDDIQKPLSDDNGDQVVSLSPVKPTESLLKGELGSSHRAIEKSDICESFIAGHTSPFSPYRVPKKAVSAQKSGDPLRSSCGINSENYRNSPETRSARKRLESDMEMMSGDRLFESVDDEISIHRSSRETTPDRESRSRNHVKRDLMVTSFNDVNRKVNTRKSRECNRSEAGSYDIDAENNSEFSITDSEASAPVLRRTRRKSSDVTDDDSVDSIRSSSRRSLSSVQNSKFRSSALKS